MEIAMYIVWPIIAVVAIIIELNTSMQIGWAASIGAIGSLIAHGITGGDPVWVEFIVFLAVWSLAWIGLFVFFKKIKAKIEDKEDGYLAYINKSYKASKGNEDGKYGSIEINDKIFRFKSDSKIKKGEKIKVKNIKGVTFIVEKEKNK